MDYILRASAGDGAVRIFVANTHDTVQKAFEIHKTSPVMSAALGRALTGVAIMGSMLKNDNDLVTITIKGDGPGKGLTVTSNSKSQVKGYVYNPIVDIPLKPNGKLDVQEALGFGDLTVIKDIGMKEPYVGTIPLISGEIAEDLTYYFATSEQVPSSVGLGVLMNKDNTVRQAGGFIIQLMPFTDDKIIDALEKKLSEITSVTNLLEEGHTPESMLEYILGDFGVEITEKIPASFYCNCSKDRVKKAIISIGKKDLKEMVADGKPIEVKCHFCNTAYTFSIEELKEILKQ